MKADSDMDVFADEHMVEMNRRQGRGGGRRHARLRLSRSPTPIPPTPPLTPTAPNAHPPTLSSSSPLPGQPATNSVEIQNNNSSDGRGQQVVNSSTPAANGPETNSTVAGSKEQLSRNQGVKPGVADGVKGQPAPFTSSALPDDKVTNATPSMSTVTPPTGSSITSGGNGSGASVKTPLDKVQQLSRKRERTPSPTFNAGLPNSKRPAFNAVNSSTSNSPGAGGRGSSTEVPSKLSSSAAAGSGGHVKNNTKAPSPLPNARLMTSASKVLTEEIQKQQGQENARLKLLIFKEIRKPGKSEYLVVGTSTVHGHNEMPLL